MRKVVVMVMLAGALCADRAVASLPQLQPQIVKLASRLAMRVSVTFRRISTITQMRATSQTLAQAQPRLANYVNAIFRPVALSPFQFRLPPPIS
jgi:hypothetical protein